MAVLSENFDATTFMGSDDVCVNHAPGPASQPQGGRGEQLSPPSCNPGGEFVVEVFNLACSHLGA